jgi:zinc protease
MLLALILAAAPPLSLPAQKTTLDNGLTVIVSPDHKVPGVAVDLWYDVGSRDEEPGRTGFAHLFEHLMFMGARHVPYPRFDTIMEAYGGTNNASTGNDTTHYYEAGPSNLLETFLWMEADRMATLGQEMTQEKLETQRKVVLNERRQSYENRPYGQADLALFEKLYPVDHPYHHPVIGSEKDLQAATLSDVKGFFSKYYVPSNASLTIVGDVDPEQAVALVKKYFGWMPKAPKPGKTMIAPVTPAAQIVPMTDVVEVPKVIFAWTSPKDGTDGDAAADLLAKILAQGKASRLYEALVHQQGLASSVDAEQESMTLQSVFAIETLAQPGHTVQELRDAIEKQLQKLLAEGVTQEELDAAKASVYTSVARELEGLISRGEMLNHFQIRDGEPNGLQKELARYEALTPQTFLEHVKKFLDAHQVVIQVIPGVTGTKTQPQSSKGVTQ